MDYGGIIMRLTNGKIVTKDTVLYGYDLIIENDKIKDICCSSGAKYSCDVVDCNENYIMPGLIDLHCDTLESIVVPRKGLVFDVDYALLQSDRQLISQGITTIYHSISVANSTIVNRKRTLSVEEQLKIGECIKKAKNLLINHKYHARLELNTIDAYDTVINMIKNNEIDELSLMDHTPGQGQYHDLEMFKKEIDKQYGELNETNKNKIIQTCQSKKKFTIEQLQYIISLCNTHKIPMAYHDVDNKKIVKWMKTNNFSICEFPLTLSVAQDIRESNLYTLVGAPNIIHGKSHNNNTSAIELLKHGLAQIICSDYYSPAMLLSIFKLKEIGFKLEEAVCFASYFPAQALGLCNKGCIAVGNIADIIIVHKNKSLPYVTSAFVNGKLKYRIGV